MADTGEQSRARLIFAFVLFGALAIGVLVYALANSGGDEQAAAPADSECIEHWNTNRFAVLLGQHQSVAHQYANVQVLRLNDDGTDAAEGEGNCTVVFAAARLDPEPGAAAQIELKDKWGPLSDIKTVSPKRLGELQSEAVAGANAHLDSAGMLSAVETGSD